MRSSSTWWATRTSRSTTSGPRRYGSRKRLWGLAADLGYSNVFVATHKHHIIDDHAPFLKIGIPSVLIIDFDYPYWHTLDDTTDKVSARSLQRVGHVLVTWLEDEPLAARAIAR